MADGLAARGGISLLLADVDGTLVTEDKVLTERARAAVHRLHEAGVRFAITSGRPPRGMAMLIEPLALDTPIAGFNGGGVRRAGPLDQQRAHYRPRGGPARLRPDARAGSGRLGLLRQRMADPRPGRAHVEREAWTVKFSPTVVDDFADALQRAAKIVGVSDDHELVRRCESDLRKALGTSASAARSQPYYVDVTHPEANKGAVVEHLSTALGIPSERIATIGDSPNDVLMFRKSGLSIAMGNASDEVKRQADLVTDSYNDEGFAKAVERFILRSDAHGAVAEAG